MNRDLRVLQDKTSYWALSASGRAVHASPEEVERRLPRHAIDTLKAIARLFYPEELSKKWIDSLTSLAAQKYGEEESFTKFMRERRGNLLFMREMRNMIEHPQESFLKAREAFKAYDAVRVRIHFPGDEQ